jgi:CheY-like chemotaxis protein
MLGLQDKAVVLYVEDEEGDTFFMRRAFDKTGLGFALRTVGDGREAIEYLSGQGAYTDRGHHPVPKVVLLDLNLPLLSGFDVLQWMRNRPDYRNTPVVVFSSSAREEDKHKALALGASEFLQKPNSGLLFGDVVEKLRDDFLASST